MKHNGGTARGVPLPEVIGQLFGENLGKAVIYHDFLADAGVLRGLLGPREVPRLWERHILNCAVIGEIIPQDARVVDIGSGAGLPGVPLALARPDLSVTLVEPLQRRAEFLHEIVGILDVDVRVVRGRAEDKSVIADDGDADVVTSRALAPLDRLVCWSSPLLREGGKLVAIKGSSASEEILKHGSAVARQKITDVTVAVCGDGIVIPPTTVVVGTRMSSRGSTGRSGRRRAIGGQ